ncbi:MAG: heavy metal-associated domain-containing protein [Ferruginibacter sp.]
MKIFFFTLLSFLSFSLSASAQQKINDKAIIKTPGLLCEECKSKVEQSLFKQYGILSYKVDLKKRTTTVAWLTDRTDIEQIKTIIANAGFDADDVTAEESVYKKLPACCRKETYLTGKP